MAEFPPQSVPALTDQLRSVGYLADRGLATSVFLAATLGRPLLLEGEVGVGKTELAKTLATMYGRQLIRLQCYEGIDAGQALYEWDYARQMLKVRAVHESRATGDDSIDFLYSDEFLVERPLLQAIKAGAGSVLLIDEVDRADDEFEAFLLEVLSDFQVTIPERGTVAATSAPLVILTSNRTRELHDALKRRCLYHWIDYPDAAHAARIVQMRIPEAPASLVEQVADAVQRLRGLDLQKPPGVAEAIDWVHAAQLLGVATLDAASVGLTLGSVLKYREDQDVARAAGLTAIAGVA